VKNFRLRLKSQQNAATAERIALPGAKMTIQENSMAMKIRSSSNLSIFPVLTSLYPNKKNKKTSKINIVNSFEPIAATNKLKERA
jgi:hypothetical protein